MAQNAETYWESIRFQPQQCKQQFSFESFKLCVWKLTPNKELKAESITCWATRCRYTKQAQKRIVICNDLPTLTKLAARKKFQCWLQQESLSFVKPHDFIDGFGDSVPTLWPPDLRDVFRDTASIFGEWTSTGRRKFKGTGVHKTYASK